METLLYRFMDRRKQDGLPHRPGLPAVTPDELKEWTETGKHLFRGDAARQALVFGLLDRCGWPKYGDLPPSAADAPWLILQHSKTDSQVKYLPLAEAAVRDGSLQAKKFVLLVDRVRRAQGRPQLYGSQLSYDAATGQTTLGSIEDEENLDIRRQAIGLSTICEYIRGFRDLEPGAVYARCKQP